MRIMLGCAIFWGVLCGILHGLIDISVRLFSLNFEWYEFHLALMLPVLLTVPLFGAVGSVAALASRKWDRSVNQQEFERGCALFVLLSLPLGPLLLAAHLAVFHDILLWKIDRTNFNSAIFFLYILAVVGALGIARQRLLAIGDAVVSCRKTLSNILFFIGTFALTTLVFDLFDLAKVPTYPESWKASPQKPNIILITLDTLRARNMSLYGYPKKTTPFIDSLAERAVVFDRAQSTSSWTLPAHASIFTGKYSLHHGATAVHQKLDDSQVTLAEILRENEYRTAGFISGPYCKSKYGLGQGFDKYHERLDYFEYLHTSDVLSAKRLLDFFSHAFSQRLLNQDGERKAPEVNSSVLEWLDKNRAGPFFLFINYFDVHDPYDQGLEYRHLFTDKKRDDRSINGFVRVANFYPMQRYEFQEPETGLRDYMIAMYDSEIAFLDHSLRELFAKLQEFGILSNSIIIITSDHGEEFYEHGGIMHKQTLYEEVLHVPMIVHYPARFEPKRIEQRVSIMDLFPTLLEILNISTPADLDALSLVPLLEGKSDSRHEYLLAELYARQDLGESELRSITKNEWKYINAEPSRGRIPSALFKLDEDPNEERDLLEENPQTVGKFKERLNLFAGQSIQRSTSR